ncbi:hypothetical protein GCM10028820_11630 [Tessaracoccus terricola]
MKLSRRLTAGVAAPAMVLGGLTLGTAAAPTVANAAEMCEAPDQTVSIFSYNDFHGRVGQYDSFTDSNVYTAADLFTPVEDERAALGVDNVALISNGDDIGGSTFVSMIQDDFPTLDILNEIGLDSATTGNHEYDKGAADLLDRVVPYVNHQMIVSNVRDASGEVPTGLETHTTFEKGGITIAVVGAVTGSLPSLVSPAGIEGLTVTNPVDAINEVIDSLGDDVDFVIASLHEGAPDGDATIDENIAASGAFAAIAEGISADADLILNAHTHQIYDWETANGTPIVQAGQYAEHLMKIEIGIDAAGEYCGFIGTELVEPGDSAASTSPVIQDIRDITDEAIATAAVEGNVAVGFANEAVSTPGSGGSGTRNVESPMSNMVAEMFYDQLSAGDTEFIGMQNPGGTRTSFDRGIITYEEAALVLPFANSLMTTQITGEQLKLVLEQQWQRDENGEEYEETPSRPFLALGLSQNVSYTMDESREWGDRITSISMNDEPIDPAKLYTVGSGSFLIAGGDNFWELGNGVNTADTGRVDLEAWVDWIGSGDALSPDYSKRGVSVTGEIGTLTEGDAPVELTVGQPLEGGMQVDTLDMLLDAEGARVSPQLPNTNVSAWIGDELVGGGEVTDGVATVNLAVPQGTDLAAGEHTVTLVVEPSGTEIFLPATVALTEDPVEPEKPLDVYTTPGMHHHNGRQWMTACEPYSQTERCWTLIWATQVDLVNGQVFKRNAWTFNNLTYLPMSRSAWANNPLGNTGEWTDAAGRQWRTECDTATTGKNACRTYVQSRVVSSVARPDGGYNYVPETKWVFNNIVRFS